METGRSFSPEASHWSSSERCESEASIEIAAEEMAKEEWEKVRKFAYNVWNLGTQGKSLSQLAVQLVKLVRHCPGVLGDHSKRLVEQSASTQGTAHPWKDVLPLPVPEDVAETIEQILTQEDFKVKKAVASGGAVRNAQRKVGIDALTYCMVVSLNCLWGGLRRGTRLPGTEAKESQKMALDRLRGATYVSDSKDSASSGGVPRTPLVTIGRTRSSMPGSPIGENLWRRQRS